MSKKANPNGSKPAASVSLDLDNLWSYMKVHGDQGWEEFPSYLDDFVPKVLDALDGLKLKITFMIVGQDAALEKNWESLRMLTDRDHEIGNHSFHHEPWLHLYSQEKIKQELLLAEEKITQTTGQKPVGFRGPGYSWSRNLIEILAENDYLYDASSLPTYIGPLARFYYFWKADLSEDEKGTRNNLFGTLKDGTKPVKPYLWRLAAGGTLLEIPVTTIPVIRTPFHLSYLLYLSRLSPALATAYLKLAIRVCQLTGTEPSFLLHPLDLLSGEEIPELAFFPGMDLVSEKKIEVFSRTLGTLSNHFELVTMSAHAKSILEGKRLRERDLPA